MEGVGGRRGGGCSRSVLLFAVCFCVSLPFELGGSTETG